MTDKCKKPGCWISSLLQCDQGFKDYTKCPNFQFVPDEDGAGSGATTTKPMPQTGTRLPWTGRALGTEDISLVSSRSPVTLVGLIGPYNSGKTTFLTSMFLHFAKTGEIANQTFASSVSLQGWQNLATHTMWPEVKGPFFPPHTADNNERVPSLLHLAFRTPGGALNEVLFTDAPGEWFTRWISNQDAADSRGANWIAEFATHYVLFIDREALASEDTGLVQAQTVALARLLRERRRNRPVIVVRSKADMQADEEVEADIATRMVSFFGNHPSFEISINNTQCLAVLAEILNTSGPTTPAYQSFAPCSQSSFLSYRGIESNRVL